MTEREAIKLSLVAFEEINKLSVGENAICLPAEIDTAMDACRKVLAQPEDPCKGANYSQASEQEPSELDIWKFRALQAEAVIEKFMAQQDPVIDKSAAIRIATALGWEPKRTWVGLTLDERSDCYEESDGNLSRFAKAIEAKLKEKNT